MLLIPLCPVVTTFIFKHPAPTQIYTLSLHDALPISHPLLEPPADRNVAATPARPVRNADLDPAPVLEGKSGSPSVAQRGRSEEHTSELQSQSNLVCRLLLEKKKRKTQKSSNMIYVLI